MQIGGLPIVQGAANGNNYFCYKRVKFFQVPQVKYDIYSCLTTFHSKKAPEGELIYPYLRTLLTFDTQGLLNVISIAFEESEFNTDLGRCQKQRLVDILLQVIIVNMCRVKLKFCFVASGNGELLSMIVIRKS